MLAVARLAEAEGFESIRYEGYPQFECLSTLTALAPCTERVRGRETVATLRAYEAAGTQYVIVKILDAADLDPVRLFARRVMPAFEIEQNYLLLLAN